VKPKASEVPEDELVEDAGLLDDDRPAVGQLEFHQGGLRMSSNLTLIAPNLIHKIREDWAPITDAPIIGKDVLELLSSSMYVNVLFGLSRICPKRSRFY